MPCCQIPHDPAAIGTLNFTFVRVQVFDWVKNHGGEPIIPFSGSFENKLVDMPQDEQEVFCKEVRQPSAINLHGTPTGGLARSNPISAALQYSGCV